MWPLSTTTHVTLNATIARELCAGDVLLVCVSHDWSPKEMHDFVGCLQEADVLPPGVRFVVIPTKHAPIVLRAPEKARDSEERPNDAH